jgi:hypothetical protein
MVVDRAAGLCWEHGLELRLRDIVFRRDLVVRNRHHAADVRE